MNYYNDPPTPIPPFQNGELLRICFLIEDIELKRKVFTALNTIRNERGRINHSPEYYEAARLISDFACRHWLG